MRYGRIGNHISATLKAEFLAHIRKLHSTQFGFKWYCRRKLCVFAEPLGKNNASELRFDEFRDALVFVDQYYRASLFNA